LPQGREGREGEKKKERKERACVHMLINNNYFNIYIPNKVTGLLNCRVHEWLLSTHFVRCVKIFLIVKRNIRIEGNFKNEMILYEL
jgi:hypothetical protein